MKYLTDIELATIVLHEWFAPFIPEDELDTFGYLLPHAAASLIESLESNKINPVINDVDEADQYPALIPIETTLYEDAIVLTDQIEHEAAKAFDEKTLKYINQLHQLSGDYYVIMSSLKD